MGIYYENGSCIIHPIRQNGIILRTMQEFLKMLRGLLAIQTIYVYPSLPHSEKEKKKQKKKQKKKKKQRMKMGRMKVIPVMAVGSSALVPFATDG